MHRKPTRGVWLRFAPIVAAGVIAWPIYLHVRLAIAQSCQPHTDFCLFNPNPAGKILLWFTAGVLTLVALAIWGVIWRIACVIANLVLYGSASGEPDCPFQCGFRNQLPLSLLPLFDQDTPRQSRV